MDDAAAKYRTAIVASIDESTISSGLKGMLVHRVNLQSACEDMRKEVLSILGNVLDYWNCAGEDSRELMRLCGQIGKLPRP